jgi:putative transport protein
MAWLGDFLHRYPALAVYLAVGPGYLIGGYKIKGFGLGPVTGSLFAGVLIGQVGRVPVSETAKSILFLMFMFGIGYSVGPQFFRSQKGDGGRSAIFGIFVTSVGLGTAFAAARYLNLDPGFAAGLLSPSRRSRKSPAARWPCWATPVPFPLATYCSRLGAPSSCG